MDTSNTLKWEQKHVFLVKNEEVCEKYGQILDVFKNKLGIKFVRELDGAMKTKFLKNDVLKKNMHYTCIACITIDFVMRIDKKNYPQVYLEECKCRVKKNHKCLDS